MRRLLFGGIILFLISVLASCNLEKKSTRAYNRAMKHAPYDVIIVPGYQYITDTSDRNRILLNVRLFWAKELYDKGIAKNIIFSGSSVHTAYAEGELMKLYAKALGIPEKHVFVENKALHTTQNLSYSYRMAKKMGFKKMAVATDPYQFSYTSIFAWMKAPGAKMLPFPLDAIKTYIKPLPDIDISSVRIKDFVPLKKR